MGTVGGALVRITEFPGINGARRRGGVAQLARVWPPGGKQSGAHLRKAAVVTVKEEALLLPRVELEIPLE